MYLSRHGHWVSLYPIVTPILVAPPTPDRLLPPAAATTPHGEGDPAVHGEGSGLRSSPPSRSSSSSGPAPVTRAGRLGLALVYASAPRPGDFEPGLWRTARRALAGRQPLSAARLPARGGRALLLGATRALTATGRTTSSSRSPSARSSSGAPAAGLAFWCRAAPGLLLLLYNRYYFNTLFGGTSTTPAERYAAPRPFAGAPELAGSW